MKRFLDHQCLPVSVFRSNINLSSKNPRRCASRATSGLKSIRQMPGLEPVPVLRGLYHFLPVIGTIGPKVSMYEIPKILHKKYGPIVKMEGIFPRGDMVFLFEPFLYEQVYRNQEENPWRPGFEVLDYYRKEYRKSTFEGLEGLMNAQGKDWRDFRTKVNPAMLKIKLLKLYSPALEEIADEMVQRLKKIKDDPALKNDINDELGKYTLESIGYIGLGDRIGCLQDNLSADHPAAKLIRCVKEIILLNYKLEFLPNPWKYFATPSFKKIMKAYDLQWEISKMYIEAAKKKIQGRSSVPDEEKSIIEKLLDIDEKVAIMMANEMMFAGIDTVSFTILGVMYELAKNPEKQDKLREEILSGDKNKRYLKACIKESLRIYPVVSANLRRLSKDHVVDEYLLPYGTEVIAPNEYLSKLDTHFPRPMDFIPERWTAEKNDPLYYGNAHPMVYLPFGFGVRSCIGRRIAELEIEIFITALLKELKVSWTGPPATVRTKVLNEFVKPFYFKFEEVKV